RKAAFHVEGADRRRPQLVLGDEVSARTAHADLFRVAEHSLRAADGRLPLQLAVVEDDRSVVRIDEVLPDIAVGCGRAPPRPRVAAIVTRQHDELRLAGWAELGPALRLHDLARAIRVDLRNGVDGDVRV